MWIDEAIKKAVRPDPLQRYEELSEFVFGLRHPNNKFMAIRSAPLIERDPLLFWKSLCAILFLVLMALLV